MFCFVFLREKENPKKMKKPCHLEQTQGSRTEPWGNSNIYRSNKIEIKEASKAEANPGERGVTEARIESFHKEGVVML